jgi:hypothetical protein
MPQRFVHPVAPKSHPYFESRDLPKQPPVRAPRGIVRVARRCPLAYA